MIGNMRSIVFSFLLICCCVPGMHSCTSGGGNSGLRSAAAVRLGMSESKLSRSPDLFLFDEHGHFGSKTQYNGAIDERGRVFVAHCRKGTLKGVEVKYSEAVDRESSLHLMRSLLDVGDSKPIEHDEDDVKIGDCENRAEFFYFSGGLRATVHYAPGKDLLVRTLEVWSDS